MNSDDELGEGFQRILELKEQLNRYQGQDEEIESLQPQMEVEDHEESSE